MKDIALSNLFIKFRKARGWCQEDAAAELDVSRRTISNYEMAYTVPNKNTVKKMDYLYGCNGELVRAWIDSKFSYRRKKNTAWTAIQTVFKKIFKFD